METVAVSSSAVDSLGYDEDVQTLEIRFQSGFVYQYLNVPQAEYDALLQAPSIGSYFNRNIRNSYPYARIGS
jgi:hypothetical protein